jgi:hypothetical protein
MEAAIAQMVEEAGADGVVDGLRFQSNASWVLSAYGEHRRAVDLALAAAETLRDQFGYRDAWSETQSIFTALEEAGLDAEVARLAGDLAETGRALIAAAETEDESSRLSWNLLSALTSYPEIQDTIAERMLSYHFHDVQDQEDLLRLMIGNALETGNRARALHLASVQIQLQRTCGVEPDWPEVARILAVTQPGPRRETAIAWARTHLAESWELPDWFADVADDLAGLGDDEAAVHFYEQSLRVALSWEDPPVARLIARPALGLSASGRCDLALPAANLAELVDRAQRIRARRARDEDVIVIDHVRGRDRTASQVLLARANCGQTRSAITAYFTEPDPDWRHFSTYVIDDIGRELGEGSNQRAWYDAYAEFLARDHFSGVHAYRDDYFSDGLAFQSHVLRQAGYFQLADDFLLAAWNFALRDNDWPADFAAIYAALPED